jgi:hypothetical protein
VEGTGWGPNPPAAHAYTEWTTDHPEYQKNLADIQVLARTLSERKIHVLFVNYPVSPHFRQSPRFQTYGPTWETGRAVMRDFRDLEAISPYVHFYDAYQDGNHDYTDSEALDWDHLNAIGAAKLTLRLDSLLTGVQYPAGWTPWLKPATRTSQAIQSPREMEFPFSMERPSLTPNPARSPPCRPSHPNRYQPLPFPQSSPHAPCSACPHASRIPSSRRATWTHWS